MSNIIDQLIAINTGTDSILHWEPTPYVGAINLAARGHALATREGFSHDHLEGMRSIVRLLIASHLGLWEADNGVVTAITCNVIDYWIQWEQDHA